MVWSNSQLCLTVHFDVSDITLFGCYHWMTCALKTNHTFYQCSHVFIGQPSNAAIRLARSDFQSCIWYKEKCSGTTAVGLQDEGSCLAWCEMCSACQQSCQLVQSWGRLLVGFSCCLFMCIEFTKERSPACLHIIRTDKIIFSHWILCVAVTEGSCHCCAFLGSKESDDTSLNAAYSNSRCVYRVVAIIEGSSVCFSYIWGHTLQKLLYI